MYVKGGDQRMGDVPGPDYTHEKSKRFERLVQEHQTSLLRTCFLYLRDLALAQDAVQETFLKAYRSLDGFRGQSSEKTWLIKIAMNTCHDLRKSTWYRLFDRRITPDMLQDVGVQPEEGDDSLIGAVMDLPARLREVVLMYYYHELSTQEIADALGIARSSVSGRLKRARERLKTLLERMEADEGP